MKRIIFILAIVFSYLHGKAQTGYACTEVQFKRVHDGKGNLLFNPSFEDAGEDGTPDLQAQARRLQSWDDDMKDLGTNYNPRFMHSPDWIYFGGPVGANNHTTEALFPLPLTGNGMVGVRNYEVIEQNFRNEDMEKGKLYIVSLNIYLSSANPTYWNASSLKCYLAKQKIEYKSGATLQDYCTSDYATYKDGLLQATKEIGSWKLDLTTYPNTNGWIRIEAVFEAPDNPGLWDYFGIDLIQDNFDASLGQGLHCEDGCVFIDDVAIREIDQCGTACSPKLNPILMSCLPTAMIGDGVVSIGGTTFGPFITLVQNAIGIDFTVDNTFAFNSVIHHQYAYDVNGLIDAGYPDYLFAWTGYPFNNPSNGLLPQDVYVYKFRVWNCDYDSTFVKPLTYIPGLGGTTQGYDIQNSAMIDCCVRDLYIQNKIYPYGSVALERADNFIIAGYNVTTPPFGNVICDVNSNVKYVSKSITLQNGFVVNPGAQFQAIYTGQCQYADVEKKAINPEKRELREFVKRNPVIVSYSISPNPSVNGRFVYSFSDGNMAVERIEVYNAMGQQIYLKERPDKSNILDLSAFGSGIFFVKTQLSTSGQFLTDKLIVP